MQLISKSEIRASVLTKRKALSSKEIQSKSEAVFLNFLSNSERIFSKNLLQRPLKIGLYAPIQGEVLTEKFFETFIKLGFHPCFPKVDGEEIHFYEVSDLTQLKPQGKLNLPEPVVTEKMKPVLADYIFVPGVAFDAKANRLGYGRGFYDRYFARHKPTTIGLAYDFQIVGEIPLESHDMGLDYIFTENEICLLPESKDEPYYRALHEKAVKEGRFFYNDPQTGYIVFTKLKLLDRGYCCKSGCRHCPYGYSRD